MFEDFEEWFAVRNNQSDEDIWPGKLSFSETKGITLESIFFPKGGNHHHAPSCDSGTITGYLDYQRPTTVVEPWVQSREGGIISANTPVSRAKSRIVASAVLKNVHLEDIGEKCFKALQMDMPAFSTWYAPQLVKSDYRYFKGNAPPKLSVSIDRPLYDEFTLKDGTNVKISSFAGTSEAESTTKVTQQTLLTFEFSDAIDLSAVQKRIWQVHTIFSFLLGHRMAQNPYRLRTTHMRDWNGQEEQITAELFFRPIFKSKTHHVEWYDALFNRHGCALTPEDLLNATSEHSDALFYLMNMVLLMEKPESLSANNFSELVGCLENFDISINGSGSSLDVTSAKKICEILSLKMEARMT